MLRYLKWCGNENEMNGVLGHLTHIILMKIHVPKEGTFQINMSTVGVQSKNAHLRKEWKCSEISHADRREIWNASRMWKYVSKDMENIM